MIAISEFPQFEQHSKFNFATEYRSGVESWSNWFPFSSASWISKMFEVFHENMLLREKISLMKTPLTPFNYLTPGLTSASDRVSSTRPVCFISSTTDFLLFSFVSFSLFNYGSDSSSTPRSISPIISFSKFVRKKSITRKLNIISFYRLSQYWFQSLQFELSKDFRYHKLGFFLSIPPRFYKF